MSRSTRAWGLRPGTWDGEQELSTFVATGMSIPRWSHAETKEVHNGTLRIRYGDDRES